MANRYAGNGGEYKPVESLEDAAFQAMVKTVMSAPSPAAVQELVSKSVNAQQPQQQAPPSCGYVSPTELNSTAVLAFDMITLALFCVSLFIVYKLLVCTLSIRIVRKTQKPARQDFIDQRKRAFADHLF